jgi:F1F0 ATPase subunit 2
MSDLLPYLLAVVAGALAGFLYFAGLWLTIRRLPDSRRPYLLLPASFLLRAALMLALFYLVAGAGLLPLAVAALVFVLVRFFLTHRWGVRANEQRSLRGSHSDAG